ncbi:MAG: tRNA (N6-threonylcarbamoyladenosine(37)-N6)-methyltransferase TrmO [Hespellia sp.]|nr:tRNA (N6-threonylcarbamoyladenosine(37)-N6)-methyltransferase TrmO [Hespellia sp.]
MRQDNTLCIKPIGYIRTDFPTKFGIPRQGGMIEELKAEIHFEKEYQIPDAFRGMEEYSHLWLLWGFSANVGAGWSPTVRPPRLGGNERKGVFATRSPFRPNPVGLSCVKLEKIGRQGEEIVLYVAGADLMDGTPVYDIKPYIPYVDSYPDAQESFTKQTREYGLEVVVPDSVLDVIPVPKREALIKVLAMDPRPAYHQDESRVYGMEFAGYDVRFKVKQEQLIVEQIVCLKVNQDKDSI